MMTVQHETEFSCRQPARTHHGSGRRSAIANRSINGCRQVQLRNLEEISSEDQPLQCIVNLTKLLNPCAVMIIYTRPAWATHRKLSPANCRQPLLQHKLNLKSVGTVTGNTVKDPALLSGLRELMCRTAELPSITVSHACTNRGWAYAQLTATGQQQR